MSKHKIGWLNFPGYKGETWNPVTGCSPCSIGCENCYAERISKRFGWPWGKPIFHLERLDQPSHWKKPRAIFVCSMSDLFHEDVPDNFITLVMSVISSNPKHLFLILTKRHKKMFEYFRMAEGFWLDNLWLGVTVEHDNYRDRIDILRQIPAAHRFISFEPLLSDIPDVDFTGISWTICGGESGPGARPMHPDWARGLRDQCQTAGVPFFFKQWGEWYPVHPLRCIEAGIRGKEWYTFDPDTSVCRIGKKAAGRLLDGREWNEFPEVSHE